MYACGVYIIKGGGNMIRIQTYPTDKQRTELAAIAKDSEKKQSEIIQVAGIWKDRQDLPDFRAMRSQWDR
jgi:hypothetical protein